MVILDGETGFMEAALQDPCGLGGVGKRKTDMPAAFLLQSGKAFLFQQCAVVNDPNIVRQQGNFRKDMAGDQNGLPSCITELPDKGTHLCNCLLYTSVFLTLIAMAFRRQEI